MNPPQQPYRQPYPPQQGWQPMSGSQPSGGCPYPQQTGGGVDVGEVDREDRVGLRGQKLAPGRLGPSRSRIETRSLQDCPHG